MDANKDTKSPNDTTRDDHPPNSHDMMAIMKPTPKDGEEQSGAGKGMEDSVNKNNPVRTCPSESKYSSFH
jgi:hypothetical protein